MTSREAADVREVDAFDLPDWLGEGPVTWRADSAVRGTDRVSGTLTDATAETPCDLLAVDQAYPVPVLPEEWRRAAHRAWSHDQLLLLEYDGRLRLAVPGTVFTADLALETVSRLARALGVRPERFSVTLRL